MTNDERMTKPVNQNPLSSRLDDARGPANDRPSDGGASSLGLRHSFVIRHSSFVILV
jgi:hypothetical protein